ncbi:MAG: tRNA preQ1(34) S-adenosylmethionine ribosyltransferase-isomerase QueA [Planctomycetota bacterium]
MTDLQLFDYDLPEGQIALRPASQRDESRLLGLDRRTGRISHQLFSDITDLLHPGDVLVLNDARVIPARLWAERRTGGQVEILLVRSLRETQDAPYPRWIAMVRASGNLQEGEIIHQQNTGAPLQLEEQHDGGYWTVTLADETVTVDQLLEAGQMPLPPYIRRRREKKGMEKVIPELDRERYQTVFADSPGAVAAPTAGLHYTAELLEEIKSRGVKVHHLSLMVGPGTFRPVRTERIEEHTMEAEQYHLPGNTATAVQSALEEDRRVIATGTTCCRVLEYVVRNEDWEEHDGWTDLYIYPPFEFQVLSGLITNFHLPRSTLLMLVSAFAGRENVLAAYREAVREGYRFYSYGDAMFIA